SEKAAAKIIIFFTMFTLLLLGTDHSNAFFATGKIMGSCRGVIVYVGQFLDSVSQRATPRLRSRFSGTPRFPQTAWAGVAGVFSELPSPRVTHPSKPAWSLGDGHAA
ncbi:MAG TPA: hypothetical protein VKB42_11220, partial [Dongiaceae bacterium]|nr:hypothetical protein [Dongiaceae bacterium]